MHSKIFFIIIGSLLLIGGFFYFSKQPKSSEVVISTTERTPENPIIIAAFGDSLTAGYGVDLSDSYPSILEESLKEKGYNVKVLNMGFSGETSQGATERVNFVLEQNPDIVLLETGANDMLRSLPVDTMEKNIRKIIEDLRNDANPPLVMLLGMKSFPTNGVQYASLFNEVYPRLAKEFSLPFVPFFLEGVALNREFNTPDGIHPNRQGYEKIVNENILPQLLPLLGK